MFKCLIRLESSREVGHGHLIRCLTLAENMHKKENWIFEFAIINTNENILQKIKIFGFQINSPIKKSDVTEDDEEWILMLVEERFFDCIVFDIRKNYSSSFFKKLKKKGVKIIGIDDPTKKRIYSDLNLYPPVPDVFSLNWEGFKGINKIGWGYTIIRKEFLNKKIIKNPKKTIIISTGGSDPNNLTCLIIESIQKLIIKFNYKLVIVLGSDYIFQEDLINLLDVQLNYKIYKNISALKFASLIDSSEFGIISFGMTAFEFLARDKPAIHLCISNSHYNSAKMFEEKGFSINLGHIKHIQKDNIFLKTKFLITNDILRKNLIESIKGVSKNLRTNSLQKVLKQFMSQGKSL